MNKLVVSLCASALSLIVVACGGSSPDRSGSSSAAIGGSAQEGEHCGGFVADPKGCDESANLYCKSSGVPDMPGTCTSCDGFGALPHFAKTCADGSTDSPHWVAKSGTCTMVVCPNDVACNDFTQCPSGLQCSGTNGGPGVCVPAASGDDAGAPCNDFAQCPSGFQCTGGNGGPGVCVPGSSDSDAGPAPSADSGAPCNDFAQCPSGFQCTGANGGPGVCVAQ